MYLVLAKYKENIKWSNIIKNKIIYSKNKDEHNYVPERFGEHSSYLKYIIDNYDNLHEWTLFAHAHEKHWHHSQSLYKSLSIDTNVLLKNNIKYLSINHIDWDLYSSEKLPKNNNYPHPMCWVDFSLEYNNLHPQWLDVKTINLTLEKIFNKKFNITKQKFPQSCQFIVHKSRILNNSRNFYKKCYYWSLYDNIALKIKPNKNFNDYQSITGPFIFEYIFHYILGENLYMEMPIINNEQIVFYEQLPFKNYDIFYKLNNILIINNIKNIIHIFKTSYNKYS